MSERESSRPEAGVAAPRAHAKAGSPAQDPTDEELEAQWKQGSSPAFAILFERWHARAYGYAMRRTNGDVTLSEDVAQRAFVNLYAKPPAGTSKGSFKGLLFTVIENELVSEARKRGRRKETDIAPTLAFQDNGSESPDATVASIEEKKIIEAALAELPEEERTVVLLREVEGLSFREVCEATGLTRDMARGRLGKALERLRRALKRRAS
ncbi:MAG TPA: RNA polymerase sigma factor [Planctomycetota bacterium]|nr:RNA polymerase sigma factor [Planctomycetota bacterium]